MTFLTPDNDNVCKDQFIIVHKCVDALQEEFVQVNRDVGHHLDHCEHANDDLCGKLTMGFQDIDTKFSELMIDDMFVKMLQWGVESTQTNLEEFKNVYSSFHEKAFTPLLGNVDANNLCLNELGKDVTTIQEDVWSLTLKVHKMGKTLSFLEKGMNSELTKLKPDVGSLQTKVLGPNDSCQEGECSRFQRSGSFGADGIGVSQNVTQTIDMLQEFLRNLEVCMTHIETQYRQYTTWTGSINDDVCCDACVRVADGLSMNTRNLNTLYNALLSKGFAD